MSKDYILISGGAGFIGFNFLEHIIKKKINLLNIDNLSYAANLKELEKFNKHKNYKFIKGDISNKSFVNNLFKNFSIKGIINFAAESHVDNSIKTPERFINSNILGTFTLLNQAYKSWMDGPFKYKSEFLNSRFHQISTDEVYGSSSFGKRFEENSLLKPNSPYSSSKAAADLIVRSYNKTYGINTLITRSSNNYGPYQNDEKFIPTIIRSLIKKQKIPIYGNGKNLRDWIYVKDHCEAIYKAYLKANSGDILNIGSGNEISNNKLAKIIINKILKIKNFNDKHFIKFVKDRPGHDFRYSLNVNKIKKNLKWKARFSFDKSLSKTIKFYSLKYEK